MHMHMLIYARSGGTSDIHSYVEGVGMDCT
jgi:hypothetical protein